MGGEIRMRHIRCGRIEHVSKDQSLNDIAHRERIGMCLRRNLQNNSTIISILGPLNRQYVQVIIGREHVFAQDTSNSVEEAEIDFMVSNFHTPDNIMYRAPILPMSLQIPAYHAARSVVIYGGHRPIDQLGMIILLYVVTPLTSERYGIQSWSRY